MRRKQSTVKRFNRGDKEDARSAAMARRQSRHLAGMLKLDPSDIELLRRFTTEHGKIMPARLTGATAKQQRQLARAIRRARVMGFL